MCMKFVYVVANVSSFRMYQNCFSISRNVNVVAQFLPLLNVTANSYIKRFGQNEDLTL